MAALSERKSETALAETSPTGSASRTPSRHSFWAMWLLFLASIQLRVSDSTEFPRVGLVVFVIVGVPYVRNLAKAILRPRAANLDRGLLLLILAIGTTSIVNPDRSTALLPLCLLLYAVTVGIGLGGSLSLDQILKAAVLAAATALLLSLLVTMLDLEIADDPNGGTRGVVQSKNWLGAYAGLVLVFVALDRRVLQRPYRVALAVLSIASIVVSNSRGGVVAAVGIVSAAYILAQVLSPRRRAPGRAVALFVLSLLTLVFVLVGVEFFLDALGRSNDLSGRTEIWTRSVSAAEARYWLGHGYGVFWSSSLDYSDALRSSRGWDVPSSHNIFLEAFLWGGLLGLSTILLLLGRTVVTWIASIRRSRLHAAAASLLLYVLALGMAENTFPSWNVYFVLLFCALSQSIKHSVRIARCPRPRST